MKNHIVKKCSYCKEKLTRTDYNYARSLGVNDKEAFSYCRNCLIGKTGGDRGCEAKVEVALCDKNRPKVIRRLKREFVIKKRKLVKRIVEQLGFIPSFNLLNTSCWETRMPVTFNKLLFKKNVRDGVDIQNEYCYLLVYSHLFSGSAPVGPNAGLKSFYHQEKSWLKLLIDSKVLKDNVLKTPRGYKCIANDGCVCNSLAELSVDNWLYKHKINHKKEVFYPYNQKLNPNAKLRTDWKVNDYFIELFGLKGEEDYDKKIDIKKLLCKTNKIELIEIYLSDLYNLNEVLSILKNSK